MKRIAVVVLALVVVALLGVGVRFATAIEPIVACDPIGDARPLCGWQNPEDLAALPGGRQVIVSEYGGMDGETPGTLSLLDLASETRRPLYPGAAAEPTDASWGAPDCPPPSPAAFSPHGVHLARRADGRLQLLAVQHGGRESVEMFELVPVADGWDLAWRGCVVAPAGSMLNDVAATPDGGFVVSHMMTRRTSAVGTFVEYVRNGVFGSGGGYVLAWRPDDGFRRLRSSEGKIPNGVEIAADGATLFVAYSGNGELRRIALASDAVEASTTDLPPLDNLSWAPDGRLLVAAARANPVRMMGCTGLDEGACPGAYAILAVDPVSLESEAVYEGGPGTPGGAGTVGVRVGDGSLLIGTFAGDRIVRVGGGGE